MKILLLQKVLKQEMIRLDGTGHYDGDLTLNSGKHPASFLVALTLPDDSVFGEDPFH